MAPHKQVSFATVIALSTLITLLIKLIRILLKWKCIHGKIMPFWPPSFEGEANLSKTFSSRQPGWIVHMGKFSSRLPRSRFVLSVTGLPAFSYEPIAIFTKEIGMMRDLGNRASLVNRAHMKRP